MYKVTFTKTFVSHFKKLPRSVQIKADSLASFLAVDFRDTRLHTKKLHGNNDWFSFRVGRDYRVVFMFEDGETIKLLDVRHRKDIYKSIK